CSSRALDEIVSSQIAGPSQLAGLAAAPVNSFAARIRAACVKSTARKRQRGGRGRMVVTRITIVRQKVSTCSNTLPMSTCDMHVRTRLHGDEMRQAHGNRRDENKREGAAQLRHVRSQFIVH